jgi:hypothetical protein
LQNIPEAPHESQKGTQMKHQAGNKTMTKTFAAQGKEKKPRNMIYALWQSTSQTEEPVFQQNSAKMAELA